MYIEDKDELAVTYSCQRAGYRERDEYFLNKRYREDKDDFVIYCAVWDREG